MLKTIIYSNWRKYYNIVWSIDNALFIHLRMFSFLPLYVDAPCWSFFPCLCFGYLLKTRICAPPAHSRFPPSLCLDTYTVIVIYYRFFRILSHIIYRTTILSVAHIDSSQSVAYLYPCTNLYNSGMARQAAVQPWELVTTLFNNSSLRHTTTTTMVW